MLINKRREIVLLLVLIKKIIDTNYIMDNNKLSSLAVNMPENKN